MIIYSSYSLIEYNLSIFFINCYYYKFIIHLSKFEFSFFNIYSYITIRDMNFQSLKSKDMEIESLGVILVYSYLNL